MSVDGMHERDLIFTKVSTLVGGRVFRGIPDAETHARFSNGDVRPYLAILFGTPFPTLLNVPFNGGESDVPHMMTFTITAYAGDGLIAERTSASVRNLLRDWSPIEQITTPIESGGGYSATTVDPNKKPSRFEEGSHFSFNINLGPDL